MDSDEVTSSRSARLEKKKQKEFVEAMLQVDSTVTESHIVTAPIGTAPSTSNQTDYEILLHKYNALLEENASLKQCILDNREEIKSYVNQLKSLEKQISTMPKNISKEQEIVFHQSIQNIFSGILSKNQLNMILRKQKRVVWSTDDISTAFTIRYFSKRCYVYLREKLKYPLPGISSLQRWASNINMRHGLLQDVLRVMGVMGQTINEFERVTVLQYDEMKVASLYEYDQKLDEVVGPHSHMQVVMARGLFAKWKQPVFVDFDTQMTQHILDGIITELHKINFHVVACVSDCGGGNLGLWKALSISTVNSAHKHPVSHDPVYFFADAPHLLKLIRNWFLDTGFALEDGQIINSEPVRELIVSTNTEISSCHKLTIKHVHCEKTKRQNVSLAAQLLSHTTATALNHYTPGPDRQLAQATAKFIHLINSWFDIMNSYTLASSVPTKQPYGTQLEEQNEILDTMRNLMCTSRCISKNTLQIFQKAAIISVNSLQQLFLHMKQKFGAKYILTHRLNQDSLENFFSQIRSRGGLHDHPSPLNAIHRMKMIILGKNPGVIQAQMNTIDVDPDEYVIAKAFEKAKVTISETDCESHDQVNCETNNIDATSVTPSTSNPTTQLSEQDGLSYIAGYIAKKFREEHPHLGDYTYKKKAEHDYGIPSWIQHLSFGGLTEPSETWMTSFSAIERLFVEYHGKTGFKKERNVIKRTALYISKVVKDVPVDVIHATVRTRLFVRIRYLNEVRCEKQAGQKRRSETENRRLNKKYKKIIQ